MQKDLKPTDLLAYNWTILDMKLIHYLRIARSETDEVFLLRIGFG